MLNIVIKATDIVLTPELKEYTEKRLQALDKYLHSDPSVIIHTEIGRTTNHHKNGDIFRAEVSFMYHRKSVYAEAEAGELHAAIDTVRDGVIRELSSYKGRWEALVRRGSQKVKDMLRSVRSDKSV